MLDLLQQIGGWILGLIIVALICAVLGVLGYTGVLIRKGTKYPIFIWLGIYLVLFFVFPPWHFFLSLLVLIVPVLGYLGIFFAPDIEG